MTPQNSSNSSTYQTRSGFVAVIFGVLIHTLKVLKKGTKKYDIELARSLEGHFESGDQFNLNVEAHDGQYHYKIEVYGRIEAPRNPGGGETLPPLPTSPRYTKLRTT